MKKTVEEYLARGFSRPYAEYFASGRKRITAVKANDDYTLTLTFDDGEKRRLDMRADSRVVWNNQIDICPDTCYVESVPITMEN